MNFFNKNNNTNIDTDDLPKHIAIIMDGNGRWAKSRKLTRKMGHKAGAETLRKITEECQRLKIKHLTVYAFSTENWNRPEDEVDSIMNLLREYIQQYIDEVDKKDVRVDVIGDKSRLAKDIQQKIELLYNKSKDKKGLNLHIALNYGGRDEIVRAVKLVGKDLLNRNISINDIDENMFEKYLDTANVPYPELMIRTSGEQRISNFLLWQLAYSEFYFSDVLWPDFNINELHKALESYKIRNRRFGGI